MFELYNKDNLIATFSISRDNIGDMVNDVKIYGKLPYGCDDKLLSWLSSRNAAKHRSHLANYLAEMDALNVSGYLKLTHGLSINDTFWVKLSSEDLTWEDVSLYSNDFDEVIQHLAFDGVGLRGIKMSSTSPEFGTSGAYEKCWIRENNIVYLYKRGTTGFSNAGLEPYCEVLASQIFVAMQAGIGYELVNYRGKVASRCKLFTNEHIGYIPYSLIGDSNDNLRDVLKYYHGLGNLNEVRRMLVCDALTFNTDRHFGNFGCLFDTNTLEIKSIAPCFDYNMSLFPMEVNDAFADVNLFINKYVPKLGDNFVSVASAVLTPEIRADLVNLKGFEYVYEGDSKFTKQRVKWLSVLLNEQIHRILNDIRVYQYSNPNRDRVSNIYKFRLANNWDEDEFQRNVPCMMRQLNVKHMSELEDSVLYLDNEWFKFFSSLARYGDGSYAHYKIMFICYMKWLLSMQGTTPAIADTNLLAMIYADKNGEFVGRFSNIDLDTWVGDDIGIFRNCMRFDYLANVDRYYSDIAMALIPKEEGDGVQKKS